MESVQVPNLPGYSVSSPIVPPKRGFGRSQSLHYKSGYAIEDPLPPADVAEDNAETHVALPTTPTPPSDRVKLPKWVELDRQVLRFYGYFVESVEESPIEDHRVRKLTIYYYLADDTIHVEEPRQDNSGMTQGVFVRRHRIPRSDGKPYALADIRVGEEMPIYKRSIHVVDCDKFTRAYLKERLDYDAPEAQPYPVDPIDTYRETLKKTDASIPPNPRNDALTRYLEAKLGKPSNVLERDTLRKYLDHNRMVLRFWCLWDDRSSLYGQRRPYTLHYFLEDDTGEILECFETNSGRDPFPVFQKRGPLIKGCGFVPLGDSLKRRETYTAEDLRIGASLVINNREFLIYDCDDFTKNWYVEKLGYEAAELQPIHVGEEKETPRRRDLPPHNGFGSREDSEQNCIMLVPKPPKKDFLKLMNKDSIVLRFAAAFEETTRFRPAAEDAARTFVVTYYMADDTIAIFERPLKNSGLVGGKFLERAKVCKPDSDVPYTFHDLYVGAVLDFHRRGFHLLEADEYTYTYMENNTHIFHLADAEAVVELLKKQPEEKKAELREALTRVGDEISPATIADVLTAAELGLCRHEIIAVQRKLTKQSAATAAVVVESLGLA